MTKAGSFLLGLLEKRHVEAARLSILMLKHADVAVLLVLEKLDFLLRLFEKVLETTVEEKEVGIVQVGVCVDFPVTFSQVF